MGPFDVAWNLLKTVPQIDYGSDFPMGREEYQPSSLDEGDMYDPNMKVTPSRDLRDFRGDYESPRTARFEESLPTFPLRRRAAFGEKLDEPGHFGDLPQYVDGGTFDESPYMSAKDQAMRHAKEAGLSTSGDIEDVIMQRYFPTGVGNTRRNAEAPPYMGRMVRPFARVADDAEHIEDMRNMGLHPMGLTRNPQPESAQALIDLLQARSRRG